jgi:hypothetical protein
MEFAPFFGIDNESLKLIFPNENDTADGYEWIFSGNDWLPCGEGPDDRVTLDQPVQIVQINRFKKSGLPNKDINRQRPPDKYAEMKFWKRAKNVQMQRQSRSKNAFDASVTILQRKEEWPYDGMSLFLDGLRDKTKLGAGW